jgi:hypothetical protein
MRANTDLACLTPTVVLCDIKITVINITYFNDFCQCTKSENPTSNGEKLRSTKVGWPTVVKC